MSVLKSENLTKSFNFRPVVKGVNIEISSGEIISLLGRNGAGKTTTFQMIVGLIKPDSGDIFLDEKNISQYSSHLRAAEGITYLPQEHSVFLKASVANNLKLILELQPIGKEERKKIISDIRFHCRYIILRRSWARWLLSLCIHQSIVFKSYWLNERTDYWEANWRCDTGTIHSDGFG